ncbi:MAG TPA: MopE-related protein, partial [Candidatus Polarisedimenticolia bacterium]|nr:MopE-related protein [Candidatus Polarisedimenticolia bacterium]
GCVVGVGECQASGSLVCTVDGSGTECTATPGTPSVETCDGLDNDCDGSIDNGFPLGGACTVGTGECAAPGTLVCSIDGSGTTCSGTPGDPVAERCDGLDNDCDGSIDNGFLVGSGCVVGVGECQASGSLVCAADGSGTECTATPGTPSEETCDGLDNDCDGVPDDDVPLPEQPVQMTVNHEENVTFVTWQEVPLATAYDVVRGDLGALVISGGDFGLPVTCMINDASIPFADDGQVLPPNSGFWYMVRPVNCSGAGSYDTGSPSQIGSRDPEMATAVGSCP